jgi:hypothetical protein
MRSLGLTLLASALLAACGTNGSGSPASLEVSAGTYAAIGHVGTTLLVRARDASGGAASGELDLTVTPPAGDAVRLSCSAAGGVCSFELSDLVPAAGEWSASAVIDGRQVVTTFAQGTLELPAPQVSATASGTTVSASWQAVSGAVVYVAQLVDAQTNQPLSAEERTAGLQATLTATGSLGGTAGVQVTAYSVDPAAMLPQPLPVPYVSKSVGRLAQDVGSSWALHSASEWSGKTLTLALDRLGPDEHLAVIPINLGGSDNTGQSPSIALDVSGTNLSLTTPVPPPSAALAIAPADTSLGGHELLRAWEAGQVQAIAEQRQAGLFVEPALRTSTAIAQETSFCVQQGLSARASWVRKSAVLMSQTAHALLYVDRDDLREYSAKDLADLGQFWEGQGGQPGVYALDTATFGHESDVDGNGKLIVFLSHELGAPANNAIVLGYFWAGDLAQPKDTSSDCSGTTTGRGNRGANGADMFYLNDLQNMRSAGFDDPIHSTFPDTLGHEFQHLINFNQHFLVRAGTVPEEVWINEGLSVTAEDLVGFGWNAPAGRSAASMYLARSGTLPYRRYFDSSLTAWQGDPIGNYQGAHAFFRYFADRLGPGVLGQLVQSDQTGRAHLEAVLGEPFERAFAEWTTALMFSGEAFDPDARFSFAGSGPWAPLHRALSSAKSCLAGYPGHSGYVGYQPLNPGGLARAILRTDGWNAFVTGTGTGAPVTITITSMNGDRPAVVVVRFSGDLPTGDGTCP